jgi:hypothetical protein
VACEKCEIWQHVDCLPDSRDKEELLKRKDVPEGTYPEYEFVCTRCKKKAKEASKVEAVKSKEQLRKERERELNRAKYARRKEREKARKEEERKRREEEQRLGLANGQLGSSPMGEIHVVGLSSSPAPPSSSPDRAPMTTGQMYTLPQYPPPNQYSNVAMSYSPQQATHLNQNTIRSPPSQYQQYQHGTISTPNSTFPPSNQQIPAQRQAERPPAQQSQPPLNTNLSDLPFSHIGRHLQRVRLCLTVKPFRIIVLTLLLMRMVLSHQHHKQGISRANLLQTSNTGRQVVDILPNLNNNNPRNTHPGALHRPR